MKWQRNFGWLMAIVNLFFAGHSEAKIDTLLQSLDQYTRIQIPVTGGSGFQFVSRSEGSASVLVDRLNFSALEPLKSWRDSRIKNISVQQVSNDRAQITFAFEEMGLESFAYIQGGMLVLDFWPKEKSKGASAKKVAEKLNRSPTKQVEKRAKKAANNRSIASVMEKEPSPTGSKIDEIFPLKKDQDLFQRFVLPMPDLKIDGGKDGIDLPPKKEIEDLWRFSEGDKKTEEGRAFEFAKGLFGEKKYGLTLKAIEIQERDYPTGKHRAELELLRAFSYRKLSEISSSPPILEKSVQILEELGARKDEKGRPLPFHRAIRLFFALKDYTNKKWLSAIPNLEYVSSNTPLENKELPFIQILLAECYVKVNQPRRAERIYRYLAEKHPNLPIGREAKYRIPSLLAHEKNYSRVAEEGESAIAAFPEYEKARSEVLFQIGEAYFWLGDYKKSEKFFNRYIEVSASNTNSGLAWVRLGEIQEVAKRDLQAARGLYMKAKNGYPFSQGDLVGTVRLARIDLQKEKDPAFIVKTLEDLLADKTITDELRRMAEFTLIDYLLTVEKIEQATEMARAGMAQTEGSAYENYKKAFVKTMFSTLKRQMKNRQYAEMLALFEKEKKWLDLYGPDTYRLLSQAYQGLGLFGLANEYMDKFSHLSRGGRSLASQSENLIVNLSKAKNSFRKGDYQNALDFMPQNRDVEGDVMRALSLFRLGKKSEAVKAADIVVRNRDFRRLEDQAIAEVAEILIDHTMENREFGKMEEYLLLFANALKKENERITFALADCYWYQKRHGVALAHYEKAIENFPKSERVDRARYNLGMSLVNLGKKEEAVKQLTKLKDSSKSVWADSAKQELELLDWEKKYSSILKTLPPSGLGVVQ